jgi:hypothetical protein
MMKGSELFEAWAPPGSVWSRWAKPVLFAEAGPRLPISGDNAAAPAAESAPEPASLRMPLDRYTAVVVDLPGAESVRIGLALAREGFLPVPLFNCGVHPAALVQVGEILRCLHEGAGEVATLSFSPDAPPAFLLDANRLSPSQPSGPGKYDNRWMVFPQDFPSVSFLKSREIRRVILLQRLPEPASDLAHVLLRWQEAGLELFWTDPAAGTAPVALRVEKPSRFRDLSYRALALIGLRRNSAGGFGSIIPYPSSGSGTGFG